MTSTADEEVLYESDPEELKRSLGMRRRQASDDEGERDAEEKMGMDRRAWRDSDELDGQGGVAEYDDDNEELDAEELEEEDEADEEEVWKETEEEKVYEERVGEVKGGVNIMRKELDGDAKLLVEALTVNRAEEEDEEEDGEGKGENEPFAVPTAGAFYMHDDRFRDNNGGRNRRMRGGKGLWESKDERKWGHDKFEELSLQEKPKEEGRRTKGHYRGRGKIRGTDRGYARGNRFRDNEHNNNISQTHVPKSVKGRGPKRYEPITKNIRHAPSSQSKSVKHPEKVQDNGADNAFAPSMNGETEVVGARKQIFGSSLNSASPPFYPSGSLNKGIAITQNKDVQTGGANKNLNNNDSFYAETTSIMQGKAIAKPGGNDKLNRDDSTNPAPVKALMNVQMPVPRSSIVNHSQPTQSKTQSRGHNTGSASYRPSHSSNQVNQLSASNRPHGVQASHVHSRGQHAMHAPSQQLGQHLGGRSQTSPPPKSSLSIKSFEGVESPSELSTSKSALVGKGKGRGSFVYGGAQVMGATGSTSVTPGDPNFPATPAFLPVMQFGGQHPGGIGPAVGMAFPGYVAQSKLGLGSSEMTWLPVLAGAAGPAQYCSSYIAVDGSYHPHPPGQMSVTGTSRDDITNKPNNEWKPSKRSELENNEFGRRQNKSA